MFMHNAIGSIGCKRVHVWVKPKQNPVVSVGFNLIVGKEVETPVYTVQRLLLGQVFNLIFTSASGISSTKPSPKFKSNTAVLIYVLHV